MAVILGLDQEAKTTHDNEEEKIASTADNVGRQTLQMDGAGTV